jgi:hypothetical protein
MTHAMREARYPIPPRQTAPSVTLNRVSIADKSSFQISILDATFPVKIDNGADVSILPKQFVDTLSPCPPLLPLATPVSCKLGNSDRHVELARHTITLDPLVHTVCGPVQLKAIEFLVVGGDLQDVLLGNSLLRSLGIDLDAQFASLALQESTQDAACNEDDLDHAPDDVQIGSLDDSELEHALHDLVTRAVAAGFPDALAPQLRELVFEFVDIFRVRLGPDPPARVPPLRVTLKPDARPATCKPRQYSAAKQAFHQEYYQQLLDFGYVRATTQSSWTSPSHPVGKPDGSHRATVDYRAVNAATQPQQWPMPHLESLHHLLAGSHCFFSFDLFKGYWQFPLAEESQHLFTVMTDAALYTPTRVPQGVCDAVPYFQGTMSTILQPFLLKTCLLWLDDILGFAKSPPALLATLREMFACFRSYGVFLSAKKSDLFSTEIKWCGRIYTPNGLKHCPDRIAALSNMDLPVTAADLQQFLFAANWLRHSIPDFARIVQPLQDALNATLANLPANKRTKRAAARHALQTSDQFLVAFSAAKAAIASATMLAYPDLSQARCLFTDASYAGWAAVITQVPVADVAKAPDAQRHQPLAFSSGLFRGSSLNWSILDKEAFPIVYAASNLRHLLMAPAGLHIYCDHRNLIYLFTSTPGSPHPTDGRLCRWAATLRLVPYVLQHIAGESNVWADLLSRWGQRDAAAALPHAVSIRRVTATTRPAIMPSDVPLQVDATQLEDLLPAIAASQATHEARLPAQASRDSTDDLWRLNGKLCIPPADRALVMSILIAAHCSFAGHRGQQTTYQHCDRVFHWPGMYADVASFCRNCLHCLRAKGGSCIPRPWGSTYQATKPNEHLHFDFLYMKKSVEGLEHVLVLKDSLSHYCRLVPCAAADAHHTAVALMSWFADFGVPPLWTTDMGSHFVNSVITELAEAFHCHHNVVLSGCSWINGSVERLNKEVLAVTRTLVSEYRIKTDEWPALLPIVQHALNHSPVHSLANHAPVEVFTSLPADSPFPAIYLNRSLMSVPDTADLRTAVAETRRLLHALHKDVLDATAAKLDANRRCQRGAVRPNFTIGDYVLVADVKGRFNAEKLLCHWMGPYRITAAPRPYIFVVTPLVGSCIATRTVHASRLKFYAHASLNVTESLLDNVAAQYKTFEVEAISQHRIRASTAEVLVKWLGFNDTEGTWEPFATIQADVPAIAGAYLASLPPATAAKLRAHAQS